MDGSGDKALGDSSPPLAPLVGRQNFAILSVGVITMFNFFRSKSDYESLRRKFTGTEALVKHAHVVWNNADVELRTLLLRNVAIIKDDRLFLAYVNAPWGQIPDEVRLKITAAVMVYEDAPDLLRNR